jgi:hypothetical protein
LDYCGRNGWNIDALTLTVARADRWSIDNGALLNAPQTAQSSVMTICRPRQLADKRSSVGALYAALKRGDFSFVQPLYRLSHHRH